jgi:hypothetical protein
MKPQFVAGDVRARAAGAGCDLDDARDRPDVEGLSERIAASTQLTRMIE